MSLKDHGPQSTYEDYKYFMQDVSHIYVGCKYTLKEILENEEISFKFRKAIADSVLPKCDGEDTLETVLYYLPADSFLVQLFKQMGAQARVNILEEKKSLFGKRETAYHTEFLTVPELVAMSPDEKEAKGIFIQELKVSKLMLATV